MEMPTIDTPMPLTVPSAVEMLLKDLGNDSLATLRATAYDDLMDHHFGLGLLIRNRCQLHDNPTLVEATGPQMLMMRH